MPTTRGTGTSAYYIASAAYRAGFRGWPLVIMTAVGLRESRGNPAAANLGDPNGGSYGVWQINGANAPGGFSSGWAAEQLSNPQANADAAYRLAGGNTLSGLHNWALQWNGKPNSVPTPTTSMGLVNGRERRVNYTIAPYIPAAAAAATAVEALGPAPASSIANVSAWPSRGVPITGAGSVAAQLASASVPSTTTKPGTYMCNGTVFSWKLPLVGGPSLTWCQVKALFGGLELVAGGALCLFGLALVVYAGLERKGPAAPIVLAAAQTGRAVGRMAGRGGSQATGAS